MVVFGNITINDTVYYTGTQTDEIMNYVCGGVLIVYMVVGLLLNSHLIHYYKANQPSWIDRYLLYISLARLVYILTSCVLVTYQLLNDSPPTQVAALEWWEVILNVLSYFSSFLLMALDTVVVTIQYSNIHCPLWTIINGSNKVMKNVLIAIGVLFTGCYAAAIIYGQMHRGKESFNFPFPKHLVIDTAISIAPFLLLAPTIMCIYLTTWIRFWYQTGRIVVGEIVKREFKLVSVLALSDILGSASFTVFLANMAMINEANICRSLYTWCFSSTMVPMTVSTSVACYMLISERGIRNNLCGRCWRGRSDYELINN